MPGKTEGKRRELQMMRWLDSINDSMDMNLSKWEIDGETVETVSDFIFGAPKSLQMVTAAMILKHAYSLEEKL